MSIQRFILEAVVCDSVFYLNCIDQYWYYYEGRLVIGLGWYTLPICDELNLLSMVSLPDQIKSLYIVVSKFKALNPVVHQMTKPYCQPYFTQLILDVGIVGKEAWWRHPYRWSQQMDKRNNKNIKSIQ